MVPALVSTVSISSERQVNDDRTSGATHAPGPTRTTSTRDRDRGGLQPFFFVLSVTTVAAKGVLDPASAVPWPWWAWPIVGGTVLVGHRRARLSDGLRRRDVWRTGVRAYDRRRHLSPPHCAEIRRRREACRA